MNLLKYSILAYACVLHVSFTAKAELESSSSTPLRPIFCEAESVMAKYATVEMDMSASGRMYVGARNDRYMPLASLTLPDGFERVTVWARIRGCSQVLKTSLNGKAHDLKWAHKVPAEWTWVNFGSYQRSELGASIRVIRSPGGEGGIDAFFLDMTGVINPKEIKDLKVYEVK